MKICEMRICKNWQSEIWGSWSLLSRVRFGKMGLVRWDEANWESAMWVSLCVSQQRGIDGGILQEKMNLK